MGGNDLGYARFRAPMVFMHELKITKATQSVIWVLLTSSFPLYIWLRASQGPSVSSEQYSHEMFLKAILPKPCKTLKFAIPLCFAAFLQTTDTLLTIMQADYTTTASRNHQRQLLAVAAAITQSAPTNFFQDGYAQIIERLNDVHFKSMFGFTVSEFDAIHHALCLPEPVQTSEHDTIDSKTAMLMLLAWL